MAWMVTSSWILGWLSGYPVIPVRRERAAHRGQPFQQRQRALERPGRVRRVPARHEHVVHAARPQPLDDLRQVRVAGHRPGGQVRDHPVAAGGQSFGKLDGRLQPLDRRRGDGHRHPGRHPLGHGLLRSPWPGSPRTGAWKGNRAATRSRRPRDRLPDQRRRAPTPAATPRCRPGSAAGRTSPPPAPPPPPAPGSAPGPARPAAGSARSSPATAPGTGPSPARPAPAGRSRAAGSRSARRCPARPRTSRPSGTPRRTRRSSAARAAGAARTGRTAHPGRRRCRSRRRPRPRCGRRPGHAPRTVPPK